MDLLILPSYKAITHIPLAKTYAIRMHSNHPDRQELGRKPLIESPNWAHVAEYVFDDISPVDAIYLTGYTLFDDAMAEKILREFHAHKEGLGALLVSCWAGMGRSPAVGIALNDIFELGHDTQALKEKHFKANWHIYNTLKETARRLIL